MTHMHANIGWENVYLSPVRGPAIVKTKVGLCYEIL